MGKASTLDDVMAQLGEQEQMAVDLIAQTHDEASTLRIAKRILQGQKEYGALDLLNDARDWGKEAQQEEDDRAAYHAFAAVKWVLENSEDYEVAFELDTDPDSEPN